MGRAKQRKQQINKPIIRLDLGCGPNPKEGFIGVDRIKFSDKVQVVADLTKRWPWKDGEVEEVHCSHTIEHFTARERVHVMNELYRVLKLGGKCMLIAPHWASARAYGDMTHQWPPVSEFWFYYLDKPWRLGNAPHDDISNNPQGYDCDFHASWGYSLHPNIVPRPQEYQQNAIQWNKEAIQDIICTLTKK